MKINIKAIPPKMILTGYRHKFYGYVKPLHVIKANDKNIVIKLKTGAVEIVPRESITYVEKHLTFSYN